MATESIYIESCGFIDMAKHKAKRPLADSPETQAECGDSFLNY